MSLLWGRFSWLRASLTDLMGTEGRDVTVTVLDGPPFHLPDNWRTWEPWLADAPNAFVASIVTNSPPVREIVNTIRGIRRDLDGGGGSEALRANCSAFLESWLKQPWLWSLKEGDRNYGLVPIGGSPPVAQGWILTTTAAPLAKASELVAMGKEIVLDHEHERVRTMAAFAYLDDEDPLHQSLPKPVGRPSYSDDPRWKPAIALILSMKEEGRRWPAIVTALDENHAAIGPFNKEQVRGIYTRERDRPKQRKTD